ncbi:hypothetical protein [Leptospira sp. GIMC2001]|uniref:hypothetical protein n=1 Tax=Leptospira sp. GIMC2001 TaxID=1513297 RepID=UPI0023497227|nr:hypothetical protein [Leptospira sp. GIMC2001]WCL47881.1 hypothetical protein O4O04_11155 [Leptospira sp. GIMC2001]
MAKKKNKRSLFQRIFSVFGRDKHKAEPEEEKFIETADTMAIEIEKARKKFANFYLTRKLKNGEEIKRKDYTIKKTNDKIYRLEGKDYQVVVITGNSLTTKDHKTTGVLHVSESILNRAIQREHSDLNSFLQLWDKEIDFTDIDMDSNFESKNIRDKKDWSRILTWDTIWKQQLILHLRHDTLALLIISLGLEFEKFYLANATIKQKKIVHDEIFYLNQGKNSDDWNPHSRNKTLTEPDLAIAELISTIEFIEKKIDKEKNY